MVTGSFRHGNLFHADPHPGNYRFGMDGGVGFVDFGCVKVLSELQISRMVKMVRAAIEGRKNLQKDPCSPPKRPTSGGHRLSTSC